MFVVKKRGCRRVRVDEVVQVPFVNVICMDYKFTNFTIMGLGVNYLTRKCSNFPCRSLWGKSESELDIFFDFLTGLLSLHPNPLVRK